MTFRNKETGGWPVSPMIVSAKLKGRPLTRDEERRLAAHTGGGPVRDRPPLAPRSHTILNSVRVEELTALFVLGMVGGIAAVFIGLFVL